jgi:hypothetical protein
MGYRVHEAGAVGAGHHTVTASYAAFFIDQYKAVIGYIGCADRANLNAVWFLAVVAELGYKEGLLN